MKFIEFIEDVRKLKNSGFEILLFTISALLYADCFSIYFFNESILTKLLHLDVPAIVIMVLSYTFSLYAVKLIRTALLFAFIPIAPKFIQRFEHDNTYYKVGELLTEGLVENNDVKYKNYLRIKAENQQKGNVNIVIFYTMIVVSIDLISKISVLRQLQKFPFLSIVFYFVFFLGLLSIIFNFKINEDENTFIKKPK